MNEGQQEQNTLRERIEDARLRRTSGWRDVLLGFGWIAFLVLLVGGGLWFGFPSSQDAPPDEPAPSVSPSDTAPVSEVVADALPDEPPPSSVPSDAAPAPVSEVVADAPPDEPAPSAMPSDAEPVADVAADAPPDASAPSAASSEPDEPPQALQSPPVMEPAEESITEPSPVDTPSSMAQETPAPISPPADQPPAADQSLRLAEAQTAIREFERAQEAELARIHSAPEPDQQAARARIALHKEKALAAYDAGDADAALRLLDDAKREAADVLQEAKAEYQRHVLAAKEAYADGDAETARRRIATAREQWPDHEEAKLWEARIERLPALLAERGNAERARAAGDLRVEQTALRRIVELDPSDTAAGERILEIDKELSERAFMETIARGRRAVDETDMERAALALADAERQRPRHAETLRLKHDMALRARELARDRHLADAGQAAAKDDWPGALQAFESAKALDPTHHDAVDGSRLAARVTAAQKAMDDLLSRADRLNVSNIAEAARRTLRDAAPLTTHSPRLAAARTALDRAIRERQTPVPVLILSDSETEIGIRGVGVIGRADKQVIELRPGAYVFEGKRRGYRSKLVDVEIPAGGGAPAEVRIVCDERI